MKTSGIDVGFDTVKIVVMSDNEVISKVSGETGCAGQKENIEKLYNDALAAAGVKADEIDKVVATGIGKYSVGFAADHIADAVAVALAAKHFKSDAAAVLDVGADKTLLSILDGDKITEVVRNQKCMAGLGLALDVMADRLGYTLDDISMFEPGADKGVFVNDGCPVFAELDSLEALNKGVPKEQVMGAVINTVVYRLNSILHDKISPDANATVMLGGVSRNQAVVKGLKARSGVDFIVPDDALFGSAIGCALFAAG